MAEIAKQLAGIANTPSARMLIMSVSKYGTEDMKKILVAASTIFLASMSSQALSYCSEPSMYASAPDAPSSYSKPSKPYCMSSYQFTGKHDCSEWELSQYLSEVEDYIEKLRGYAEAAQNFAEEAISFSSDAIDYANCEIRDAAE